MTAGGWTCAAGVVVFLGACNDGGEPITEFERMLNQARYEPYEACEFFEDGRAMRTPPEDTVPRDRVLSNPALTDGVVAGAYVDRLPIRRTRLGLARGRERFETFCAACHGIRGDGVSRVAQVMDLRKPPSLLTPSVRAFPPGRVYQVITLGYGLMRPYAEDLGVEERWDVVAYLRALQLSQTVRLEELPPRLRAEAEEALR